MTGKFDVVTGIKRSGTSAMMLALKSAGIDIGGYKWPFQTTNEKGMLIDAGGVRPIETRCEEDNPTGFWEYSSISSYQVSHKSLSV